MVTFGTIISIDPILPEKEEQSANHASSTDEPLSFIFCGCQNYFMKIILK
jgi:hypothetical protein